MVKNEMASLPATESGALSPGAKVLHYTVLGLIAEGGMAQVYLARDEERDPSSQVVVLKRVRPRLLDDERFETMLVNEARLAHLIDHPNVVQVLGLERSDRDLFLVMEFLHGKNLLAIGKTCDTGGFWVPHTLLARILSDAAAGIHRAHTLHDERGRSLDLVHRDLSPENVIVTFEGHSKVVDFGVAKARMTPDTTQVGVVKGKLNYLSPEAIRGKTLDARADIYAIGVTLYLFLTARFPYEADSTSQLLEHMFRKDPPLPSTINPTVPEELEMICLRCLERERDRRYQSANTVRLALERYLSNTGQPVTTRHVAAFMNQLYPKELDPMRRWVDSITTALDALGQMEAVPQPQLPQMQHGGTADLVSPEEDTVDIEATAEESLDDGDRKRSGLWAVPTDINQRVDTILTNLEASGLHVARHTGMRASALAGPLDALEVAARQVARDEAMAELTETLDPDANGQGDALLATEAAPPTADEHATGWTPEVRGTVAQGGSSRGLLLVSLAVGLIVVLLSGTAALLALGRDGGAKPDASPLAIDPRPDAALPVDAGSAGDAHQVKERDGSAASQVNKRPKRKKRPKRHPRKRPATKRGKRQR